MSDFPPDFAVEHDQQVYRPVCVIPRIDRNGEQTRFIEWITNCPACGQELVATTGMRFREPRRRCDACKAPGRHVKTDRKHFRVQLRGDEP